MSVFHSGISDRPPVQKEGSRPKGAAQGRVAGRQHRPGATRGPTVLHGGSEALLKARQCKLVVHTPKQSSALLASGVTKGNRQVAELRWDLDAQLRRVRRRERAGLMPRSIRGAGLHGGHLFEGNALRIRGP